MSKDTETDNTILNETSNKGSLGSLLQEYRELANLDVQGVAQALRLPVSAVEALENENFSVLPEPPYVRGYLRSYARLADADPQESIALYESLRGSDSNNKTKIPTAIENPHYSPKNPPMELISPFRFKMGLLTLGILVLIVLSMIPSVQEKVGNIWRSFSPEQTEQPVSTIINTTISNNVAGNLPVSDEPIDEPTDNANESNQSPSESDEGVTETNDDSNAETPDSETPVDENPQSVSETASDTESAATADSEEGPTTTEETDTASETPEEGNTEDDTSIGNTKLKLVFTDEVWIRIDDNKGERLFEALNPPGTEKELALKKPMKFKVGNAQGMTLFVDDVEMDITEYTNGSVAKFGLE